MANNVIAWDRDNPLLTESEKIDGRTYTKYVPEVAWRVCELIAQGKTFDEIFTEDMRGSICKQSTFLYWCVNYGECKQMYVAAQAVSAYVFEDMALQNAKTIASGPGSPQRVAAFRVLIDQLNRAAGRRNPSVFSEKAPVHVTVPIQINTGLDMGDGTGKTLPKQADGQGVYTLEAHIETVSAADIIDAQAELVQSKKLIEKIPMDPKVSGAMGQPHAWKHKKTLTPKGPKVTK